MEQQPPDVDIDVVVVNWNGRHLLTSCLAHLARQEAPHQVIVADNASHDGSVEMLRAEHPEVSVVALPENVGFGAGNNRGVASGDAPYVVLVNNDVDVAPGFLERIVQPLRDDPAVGAVAGLTTRPGTNVVDQFGVQLDAGLCAYARATGQDPDAMEPGPLAAPCGAAVAYRRTAYEQVGGFDETLFAYSEDLDLGLRLLAAGWTFADAPGARGVHLGGASTGAGSPMQRKLGAFGRGFVLGRYRRPSAAGQVHAAVVDLAVVVFALLRYRTVVPLTERVRGFRAARRTPRQPVPAELIDRRITLRSALARLAGGA
ncbi:MAG: glycosyltransferase family 2 protein [Patulibacter minatonensis]